MKRLAIKDPGQFLFALFLLAMGAAGIIGASQLRMGIALRMGPGYVPMILSVCLVLFGIAVLIRALRIEGPPIGRWPWKEGGYVFLAILFFAVFVERLGLAVSTMGVVLLASLASPERRWLHIVLFALGLVVLCVGVFKFLLGLPLSIFPPFIGLL